MDLTDASLTWPGTKLKIADLVTIERGDFPVYRTANGKPFRNLFELSQPS